MNKKQLRALAILYAANLIYAQQGTGWIGEDLSEEEFDFFYDALRQIAISVAGKRGVQGLQAIGAHDFSELVRYCKKTF